MVDIDKVITGAKAYQIRMSTVLSPTMHGELDNLLVALEQSQKEAIEHQLELLARDTDILLLEKRVEELKKQLYFASLPKAELEETRWDIPDDAEREG